MLNSPLFFALLSFIYVIIIIISLYYLDFLSSDFFRWGPPIVFFGKNVETNSMFYLIWFIVFTNNIIFSYLTEIVYPYIVNSIKDPKSKNIIYSKNISMLITLLNGIYYNINNLILINTSISQISLFISNLLGNLLVIYK